MTDPKIHHARFQDPQARRAKLLLSILKTAQPTQVIDIGANPIHPAPYDGLMGLGAARLWGFEPHPAAYQALVDQNRPHQHFFPIAVGDGKTHPLHICAGSGFTSLLEPDPRFNDYINHFRNLMRVRDIQQVETSRLDDVNELPQAQLLKIDIQGGEAMVFEHGTRQLSSVLAVITEAAFIPLYKDQPLLDEQMRILRAHGLELHKFQTQMRVALRGPRQSTIGSRHMRNQLTDGDAVFIRPVFMDDTANPEDVKHLAILAETVFDSVDLTIRCLENLENRGLLATQSVDQYMALLG